MDIKKLRSELIQIYKSLLENPDNPNNKKKAARLYEQHKNLEPVLDLDMSLALNSLVDVVYDTGIKLSGERIKEILGKLRPDDI